MMKRVWLVLSISSCFILSSIALEKPNRAVLEANQPNVVFFLIDDLSHLGVSAYGANRISSNQGIFTNVFVSTPRIDALGEDGLRCEFAYAYPLCEPSRVALMTGMNNDRNFIQAKALHDSHVTIGDVFQRAGYVTGITGKWKQSRGTKEFPGKEYVAQFGWDEFYCFDVIGEGKRMIEPFLVDNGKVENYRGLDPQTGRRYYGPDLFNRYALDFIERHQDEPFFLYYPMVLVHDEHTPTPDTRPKVLFDDFDVNKPAQYGSMTGDERRYFPDMLRYMDKMIGQVLDQLDALNLSENTLVIVMGDNGTKECFSHVFPDGTLVSGGKGSTREQGLRVPLLLRWPERIPAGQLYKGMVNITDLYPTLCEAIGVKPTHADQLDGLSFLQQAMGLQKEPHRNEIYTWYNANRSIKDQQGLLRYAHTQWFKRYAPHNGFPTGRFFDLREDPNERAGERIVKYKWDDWHYAGLDISQLTDEQKSAFDQLGNILEAHRFVAVEDVKIEPVSMKICVGDRAQLHHRVMPEQGTRSSVIWKSSDLSIASINKFGVLQAHRVGDVTISIFSWHDAYPVSSNVLPAFSKTGISDSIKISIRP